MRDPAEIRGGSGPDVVDGDRTRAVLEKFQFYLKFPLSGLDLCRNRSAVSAETDHFPALAASVGCAAGQAGEGFQQIGLSLCVFSHDHVALWMEICFERGIVAEVPQFNLFNPHLSALLCTFHAVFLAVE